MIFFVQLTTEDASLLSRIGGISLLESHGHSQPMEIMQAYVDRSFTEEKCREELSNDANIFSAVYYNNEPAGYSKIILNTPHQSVSFQPVTKLERLYLLKAFHDLKLGNELLENAIERSKGAGDKGMWLEVWKGNDRALRFYERKGFSIVGETRFMLTPTHSNPAWVMLKEY